MNVSKLYQLRTRPLPLLAALACSSGQPGPLFGSLPGSAALVVHPTGDEAVQWMEYRVLDGGARVLLSDTVQPDAQLPIALDFHLPPGDGYALELTGETASGQACAGAAAFDVVGGRSTEVTVDLICAPPEPDLAELAAPPCPVVSIAASDTDLPVGSGVILSPRIEGDVAATPVWTASAGQLDQIEGETRFTCTEAGTVQIQLGVELSGTTATCAAERELTISCSSEPGLPSACAATSEPIRIQFAATVGSVPFSCGGGAGALAGAGNAQPSDFRFFVHEVQLLDADGGAAAVALDERAPFQALGTALIDFEDATGSCGSGDASINTVITGRVRPGAYSGVRFQIGVPEAVNHADPALQPAPLGAGTMSWGWLAGYKFLRAELASEAGAATLHLGTTACTGDPAAGAVSCARSNRPSVTLDGFSAASDTIVADLGALFEPGALESGLHCHSTEASCQPSFAALGLDLQGGSSGAEQRVFRVVR